MRLLHKHSPSLRFTILATVIGNTLEWYEAPLFGLLAPLFARLFFSHDSSLSGLVHPFIFYALSSLARPIGGLIFGYYGDRYGRKGILVKTITLMLIPVVMITFLPTYSTIGILSTVLLLLICILQGFSVGGEFSTSIVFLAESAPNRARSFAGSWAYFGIFLGMLISSLDFIILGFELPKEDFYNWGWKFIYYIGILLGVVGIFLRFLLHETPDFTHMKFLHKGAAVPLSEAIKKHFSALWIGFFAFAFDAIGFNLIFVFPNSFLVHTRGYSFSSAFIITMFTILTAAICMPFSGFISGRFGMQKVAKIFLILSLIFSMPLYYVIANGTFLMVLIAQMIFAILLSGYLGNLPKLIYELFPTQVRLTSASLIINLSVAILGGSAPLLMVYLIDLTKMVYLPGLYLFIGAAMSFIAFTLSPKVIKRPFF